MAASNSQQVDTSVVDQGCQKLYSKHATATIKTLNSDCQRDHPKLGGATDQESGTEDVLIQKFKQYGW